MGGEKIQLEKKGQIALLRLNRPGVHNAIDAEMMSGLEAAQREIYGDADLRIVLLTAAGSESFCSGGDLKHFAGLKTREAALDMSRRMQRILNRFWLGDRVVIAAVNGRALGGGCEILTACHFRIAAETAQFSFRQAANGLITGWGGGVRLFSLLGKSRALRLLLTSQTLNAGEALEAGFIDRVVARADLQSATTELAEKILRNSPAAVNAFLEISSVLDSAALQAAAAKETELFGNLWVGEDFRTWLSGFLKRR